LETTVAFEKAEIKIEKAEEFGKLQAAIEREFLPQNVERFLKQMDRKGIRIRDFDGALAKGVFDREGVQSRQLYDALTLSDQAQMREFYLSKLEAVDVALRHRFKKLYQYY
jgi:hypothetical protein